MLTEHPVLAGPNKRYQLDLVLVIIGDHDFLTLLNQSNRFEEMTFCLL
jgi:hypothetical protein